jgi:hypothetical protein
MYNRCIFTPTIAAAILVPNPGKPHGIEGKKQWTNHYLKPNENPSLSFFFPFCSPPNWLVAVANLWASRNTHRLGKKMEEARRGGGTQGAEEEEAAHREKTPGKRWWLDRNKGRRWGPPYPRRKLINGRD